MVIEDIEFDERGVAGERNIRIHNGKMVVIIGERIREGIGDGVRGITNTVLVAVFAMVIAPIITPTGVGIAEIPVVVILPGIDEVIVDECISMVAEKDVMVEKVVVAFEEGDSSAAVLTDGVITDDTVTTIYEYDTIGVFVYGVVGYEAIESIF